MMTEKQLLQYYMWLSADIQPYCKNAVWDKYSYDCPYEEYHPCATCPYWALDFERASKDAEEDIAKFYKNRVK